MQVHHDGSIGGLHSTVLHRLTFGERETFFAFDCQTRKTGRFFGQNLSKMLLLTFKESAMDLLCEVVEPWDVTSVESQWLLLTS